MSQCICTNITEFHKWCHVKTSLILKAEKLKVRALTDLLSGVESLYMPQMAVPCMHIWQKGSRKSPTTWSLFHKVRDSFPRVSLSDTDSIHVFNSRMSSQAHVLVLLAYHPSYNFLGFCHTKPVMNCISKLPMPYVSKLGKTPIHQNLTRVLFVGTLWLSKIWKT